MGQRDAIILDGIRVLIVGDGTPARVAGWWMSAAGAAVSAVGQTPPNSGGSSRWSAQVGRRVEMIDSVGEHPYDVVIGSAIAIATLDPASIDSLAHADVVEITSPLDEPASFEAGLIHDMTLYARSGLGYLTREIDSNGVLSRPALPMNRQAGILAGIAAGVAAIGMRIEAEDAARKPRRISIDQLELIALMPMQPIAFAEFVGRIVGQDVAGRAVGGTVPSKNGLAYVGAVEPAHWARLLTLIGDPGGLADRVVAEPGVIREHHDLVDDAIRRWSLQRTTDEIADQGQDEHLPVAPVYSPAEVVADRHLGERGFFRADRTGIEVPWLTELGRASGRPARTMPNRVRSTPPNDHNLPLSGVRVLDLSWAWAGPFATTMMADLGAEVVNVEWHPRASNLRRNAPFAEGRSDSHNTAGWWSANHRGKLSIGVNMKSAEGRRVILDLAARSDVVVENFSPGVVNRLGVGYDDLLTANPRLVYVSLSAFGQSGPRSHYVGYGTQLFTASGAGHATSQDGKTISQMFIPFPDPVSGLVGAFAIAAHVRHARQTGTPAKVDVSELEAIAAVALEPIIDAMQGQPSGNDRRYLVVETADRQWVAFIAETEHDWSSMARLLGADDSADETLRARASELDRTALTDTLIPAGHTVVPLAHIGEVLADDYLAEREFWRIDSSPEVAPVAPRIGGSVFTVDGRRTEFWRGAPLLFGDTRTVLGELLDYPRERIESLIEQGAVATSDPDR